MAEADILVFRADTLSRAERTKEYIKCCLIYGVGRHHRGYTSFVQVDNKVACEDKLTTLVWLPWEPEELQ